MTGTFLYGGKSGMLFVRAIHTCMVIAILGTIPCAWASETYNYPFSDPLVATIIGTPPEYQSQLPNEIRARNLDLPPLVDRPVPKVFWYQDRLRYSLAYHNKPAPLIFIIAGAGSDHTGSSISYLQRVFFFAGFHVVSLPSPLHPNFIVTASTTAVPGNLSDDSRDLYRVMEAIWRELQKDIDVTDFLLTGYSLGAAQAAFIAHLDEQKGTFAFSRVLLINPPVSVFDSANRLDRLLDDNIPGGIDNLKMFYESMLARFADIYKTMDHVEFDADFLYSIMDRFPTTPEERAALVGLSFRFSASSMIFTSDVVTKSGVIVPRNQQLSPFDSLTDYFKVTIKTSFIDYFNELYYPLFAAHEPSPSRSDLLGQSNLRHIAGYLTAAHHIGLMTNVDDMIYGPEDLAFLRQVFGDRATMYPKGGHCGNLAYRDNVEKMVTFFTTQRP